MRRLFPKTVSYNRFVELQKLEVIKLEVFVKTVLMDSCTGISFIGTTPLKVCKNQCILQHKIFKGIAQRGKCSVGWFFVYKLHIICNDMCEIFNFMFTAGNVDDRDPLKVERFTEDLYGKIIADRGASVKTCSVNFSSTVSN